jgi:malic enzyme
VDVQPEEVRDDVAIMATGRSDYPNQINNVLAFPGVFKGALDVRARTINEEMKLAAAHAIARVIPDEADRDLPDGDTQPGQEGFTPRQISSVPAPQALDHPIGQARARLAGQVHQALERSSQRPQHAAAARTHAQMILHPLELRVAQVAVEVVGQVRVGPVVLAHVAAALEQAADHRPLSR